MSSWLTRSEAERLVREDMPYLEPVIDYMGASSIEVVARLVAREEGVLACTEEAAEIYSVFGGEVVRIVGSGALLRGGEVVLEVRGPARAVFAAWRPAQVVVSYMSGVATYTRAMVERARRVRRDVVVATTRQVPPGARVLWHKAVVVGGGVVHRQCVSDEILVFRNHLSLFRDRRLGEVVSELRKRVGYKHVGVEVSSLEEALEAVEAGASYIQFDHVPPERLKEWVRELKSRYPWVSVGAGGGVSLENIEDYVSTGVDVIVTSAPYRARPLDFSTVIERA